MLSARFKMIEHYKKNINSDEEDANILNKLVAYTSKIVRLLFMFDIIMFFKTIILFNKTKGSFVCKKSSYDMHGKN